MLDSQWQEHLQAVYRFSMRLTGSRAQSEDLAQDAILRGWESRHRLKEARATRCWLLKIASNLWRDKLRRGNARPSESPLADFDHPQLQNSASSVEQSEHLAKVLERTQSLPERQKQVLHLHAVEELSLQEIADVLGITTDATKASLYEARKTMREWLAERECESGTIGQVQKITAKK